MQEKRKQIILNIAPELHKEIKIQAAKRGISMAFWITRALLDKLSKEKVD